MENKPREIPANEIASSAAAAVRVGNEDRLCACGRHLRTSGPEHEGATDMAGQPGRGYCSFFANAVEGMYRATLDGCYQVLEAEDGPSALTVLREADRIDLLFTNLVLPHGMSGVALALEARKHHLAAQVLYMSGFTQNMIGQKGILDDGGALIGKPFAAIELAHALREALDEAEA